MSTAAAPIPQQLPAPAAQDPPASEGAPSAPPAGAAPVARGSGEPTYPPPPGGPDGSHPPPPGPGGPMNHEGAPPPGGPLPGAGPPPPPHPMYRYGPPPPQVYRYGPPPPHHYKMPPPHGSMPPPHGSMPPPPVPYNDGRGMPPPYDGKGGPHAPPPPHMPPMNPYGYGPPMPMHVPSYYPPPHPHQMMYYPPPPTAHPPHGPMSHGPQHPQQQHGMKGEGGLPPPAHVPPQHAMKKEGMSNDRSVGTDKPLDTPTSDDGPANVKDGDGKEIAVKSESQQQSETAVTNAPEQDANGDAHDVKAQNEQGQDDQKAPETSQSTETPVVSKTATGPSTVHKPVKKESADDTPATAATAATVDETMSQISPQALNTSRDSTLSSHSDPAEGDPTPQGNAVSHPPQSGHHVYQTHQKAPQHPDSAQPQRSPPRSSPPFSAVSRGSFSAITNPPSASAFYSTGPPPPPGSSGHLPPNARVGGPAMTPPYMYQYQHYDPRSHVEVPMPPKRNMNDVPRSGNDGYYGNGSMVPPTVHMPNNPVMPGLKDVSPLNFTSAVKGGAGHPPLHHPSHPSSKPPATPRATPKESDAATAIAQLQSGEKNDGNKTKSKGSPLDLLSSVSTSPAGKHHQYPHRPGGDEIIAGGTPWRPDQPLSHPYPHTHQYSYPPAPGYLPPPNYNNHNLPQPTAIKVKQPSQHNAVDATPAPKSSSLCDLILSAANTLDHEDKAHRKRKLANMYEECEDDDDDDDIKKKLLKKAPAPTNLFSVGGYPPGFDPSTLPPSRSSLKPAPKSLKGKIIDPDTVTQAQKASMLAAQALERPRVGKQLLLSMALVRTNPRTPPSCYPAHGTILTDRFHWAAFPPLDMVLRKHMKKYYELSTNKCQSRDQQEFNNELVLKIRAEAKKYGWEFDDKAFDDKKIRDRIRCFFKTHIQNAKKRLKTMLRNPEKRANIKALAAHFHLIEEKGVGLENDHSDDSDDEHHNGVEHDSLGFGLSQSYSSEVGDHNNQYHHHHHHHHPSGEMTEI